MMPEPLSFWYRHLVWLTLACLLIPLAGSGAVVEGCSSGSTAVSIVPPSAVILEPGEATTDVVVEDVSDLYGFELQASFDPTVVEAKDIQVGQFLSPDWVLEKSIDNDRGAIALALSQRSPSPPRSGDGVLFTVQWGSRAGGQTPVSLSYAKLAGPDGAPIPADTEDSRIEVVARKNQHKLHLPFLSRDSPRRSGRSCQSRLPRTAAGTGQ